MTWSQFRNIFKLEQALIMSPILANVSFAPSLTDPKEFHKKRHFISFDQLRNDFEASLEVIIIFRGPALCHFITF